MAGMTLSDPEQPFLSVFQFSPYWTFMPITYGGAERGKTAVINPIRFPLDEIQPPDAQCPYETSAGPHLQTKQN